MNKTPHNSQQKLIRCDNFNSEKEYADNNIMRNLKNGS